MSLISIKWSMKKIVIIYFVVQRVGSLSILSGGMITDLTYSLSFIMVGFLLKSRLAPLHFWGPLLVASLNNLHSYVFLTWQKIAPIMLLINIRRKLSLVFIIVLNLLVSSFCSTGTKNLKIFLFFSGLMHICWVMASPWLCAVMYMVLYVTITSPVFFSVSNLSVFLLNLAGLPPITGFFIKLIVLQMVIFGLGVFLLGFSVFILYTYLRLFLIVPFKKPNWALSFVICSLGVLL